MLRAQGFEIDEFLARYKRISRLARARIRRRSSTSRSPRPPSTSPRSSPRARSRTACSTSPIPRCAQLLAWHAAEEIEHKAVAFDVLQAVDPSYALRIAGLVVRDRRCSAAFWLWGDARCCSARSGSTLRGALARAARSCRKRDPIVRRVFVRGIRAVPRAATSTRATTRNERPRARLVRRAWYARCPRGSMKLEDKSSSSPARAAASAAPPRSRSRKQGARIAACDVDQARLDALAAELGDRALLVAQGRRRRSRADGARSPTRSTRIAPAADVIVNNAGVAVGGSVPRHQRSTTGTGCSASTCAASSTAATSSSRRWSSAAPAATSSTSRASSASIPAPNVDRVRREQVRRARVLAVAARRARAAQGRRHRDLPGHDRDAIVADGRMAGDARRPQGARWSKRSRRAPRRRGRRGDPRRGAHQPGGPHRRAATRGRSTSCTKLAPRTLQRARLRTLQRRFG